MGAMRPQTPHRSPQQAFGGIHKVPAYGGIIKIAPVTLFSLPDYMPGIRGSLPKWQRTASLSNQEEVFWRYSRASWGRMVSKRGKALFFLWLRRSGLGGVGTLDGEFFGH